MITDGAGVASAATAGLGLAGGGKLTADVAVPQVELACRVADSSVCLIAGKSGQETVG